MAHSSIILPLDNFSLQTMAQHVRVGVSGHIGRKMREEKEGEGEEGKGNRGRQVLYFSLVSLLCLVACSLGL